MEELFTQLTSFGSLGIITALLCYDVFILQKKLIEVIETNTKAMQDLKSFCANKKQEIDQ